MELEMVMIGVARSPLSSNHLRNDRLNSVSQSDSYCRSRIYYIAIALLLIRVLMAGWLPPSYSLNQVIIIALGLWAIVHRESVIQVELVRS
jgi:hypothetical protein